MTSTFPIESIILIVLFFCGIFFFLYKERKNIYFQLNGGFKGEIYYTLHKKIVNEKHYSTYEPHYILKKYFKEVIPSHKNDSLIKWQIAKEFWNNIYREFPDEFVAKLESDIKIADINFFEKLAYSKHPHNIQTAKEQKDILNMIINKAIIWAKTDGMIWQATRLGYFAIKSGLIEVKSDYAKDWLNAWNEALLKVENIEPLISRALIKNPWDEGDRRNERTIKANIAEIKVFFVEINWNWGILEIINNEQN